eukprot:TRINITY_DN77244_c0_g1_i1.p1 TRINITY_DN77244_c0_g1~~TRINITY_DN77244_c0_g1_i1.p1  ORF type:complete len:370 (+),score=99.18 TRINITY_DN77244_c0_g1_i1:26-1111(+)
MTCDTEVSWQTPRELEGVKSRKKALFEISLGHLDGNSSKNLHRVKGLKVTLESRICAVGQAGRVALELLLGSRELSSGKATRHECLQVAHIGPHLAEHASTEEHLAAAAAALRARPQIVILDEAPQSGDDAWAAAFQKLLEGHDDLRRFRGALLLAVEEQRPAIVQLCRERWQGAAGWLWQEPMLEGLELLEDVLNEESAFDSAQLLQEVRELSQQVFFGEDSVQKARDRGWTLALLLQDTEDRVPGNAGRQLCGFMCYQISPKSAEFHIARLAVVAKSRGCGYGHHLMQWALQKAAMLPRSQCAWISLSALDEAVPFYERFGFTDMTCDDIDDDEHIQTWMELKNISVVPEESEDEVEDQ